MGTTRKVILFIACSLDGFIAKPNDDLSFLDQVSLEGEDYGYNDFILSVDTVIIGRKTYDWVIKHVGVFPHEEKETNVITRTPRNPAGRTHFYTADIKDLIIRLTGSNGKNIFVDGGAEIVNLLLKDNLIDEYIISVVPIILGDGVRLFKDSGREVRLKLMNTRSYKSGLVQLHYIKE